MDILQLIGRTAALFNDDIANQNKLLVEMISKSRVLVIGSAGSIGQAVTREIFKRNPLALHIVDISENNMVELVRDIRSTLGYIDGEFKTFAIDCGSIEFEALMNSDNGYDYVLNLSALKHVTLVVGNSSSGLVEAPSFKIPTINIGSRQDGRLKASSVIDCNPKSGDISKSIKIALQEKFQNSLKQTINPYGLGGASTKIKETLKNYDLNNILIKKFYDL